MVHLSLRSYCAESASFSCPSCTQTLHHSHTVAYSLCTWPSLTAHLHCFRWQAGFGSCSCSSRCQMLWPLHSLHTDDSPLSSWMPLTVWFIPFRWDAWFFFTFSKAEKYPLVTSWLFLHWVQKNGQQWRYCDSPWRAHVFSAATFFSKNTATSSKHTVASIVGILLCMSIYAQVQYSSTHKMLRKVQISSMRALMTHLCSMQDSRNMTQSYDLFHPSQPIPLFVEGHVRYCEWNQAHIVLLAEPWVWEQWLQYPEVEVR